MVDCGSFDRIDGKKVELIRGELRFIDSADRLNLDFQEKADIYAEAGVQEYWVVDVPSSRVHVLSKSDGKSYRRM